MATVPDLEDLTPRGRLIECAAIVANAHAQLQRVLGFWSELPVPDGELSRMGIAQFDLGIAVTTVEGVASDLSAASDALPCAAGVPS